MPTDHREKGFEEAMLGLWRTSIVPLASQSLPHSKLKLRTMAGIFRPELYDS